MADCIFCKLANHEIEPDVVYENDLVCAFRDAAPVAPVHVLCVPKAHVSGVNDLDVTDTALLSALVEAAQTVVQKLGIAEEGYRLVINSGERGGQSVGHLHLHVLGGRDMQWPPG